MPPDGAQTTAEPPAEPEVLSFGPAQTSRTHARVWVVAALAVAAVLAGLVVWRLLPEPPRDFTATDLAGVYAGMVRADGQNEVSVLDRSNSDPSPVSVRPAECGPLFSATMANEFPAEALDGVSTYWLNEGPTSISLFTFRYPDSAAAERTYRGITAALATCASMATVQAGPTKVELKQLATGSAVKLEDQVSYLVAAPSDTGRFATQVFVLANTVTWQYRYDYGRGAYSPMAAQQLTDSLVTQMRSVQAMPRQG